MLLRDAMNSPPNAYSGSMALGPGSGVPRAAREGIDLSSAFVDDLRALVGSGVTELRLERLGGTLHIRAGSQLMPPEHAQASSDNFCVLTFVASPGRYTQFEIDLGRGAVTVARKPSLQNGKKRGFLNCLGHMDTTNLLTNLVHQARLQVMSRQNNDAVVDDSASHTAGQIHAALSR